MRKELDPSMPHLSPDTAITPLHPRPRGEESDSDPLSPCGGRAGVGPATGTVASHSRETDPEHGIPLWNANADTWEKMSPAAGGTGPLCSPSRLRA